MHKNKKNFLYNLQNYFLLVIKVKYYVQLGFRKRDIFLKSCRKSFYLLNMHYSCIIQFHKYLY